MSDAVIKSVRRSSSHSVSHDTPSAKTRKSLGKSVSPAPIVKRPMAEKAPVQKAVKSKATSGAAAGVKATKSTDVRVSFKKTNARVGKTKSRAVVRTATKSLKKSGSKGAEAQAKRFSKANTSASPPQQPNHQAAAIRAFDLAHKAFARARFGEARTLFRALIEMHTSAVEVVARARTYLAITEARLQTERALPRDADGLYDRGVIELNCGEYAAAQEFFERALKREPEAAHIHYGLAATRARLGAASLALQSLEYALNIQPSLRIRAQNDQDLATLRHEPEFERIVFVLR